MPLIPIRKLEGVAEPYQSSAVQSATLCRAHHFMNKQKQLEEMARRKPLKAASHDLDATVTEVQRMRRERNLPEWSRREIVDNFNSTHEKLRRGR